MKLAGGPSPLICKCGASMNEDESRYYGMCETCARIEWERVLRWKAGEHDAELDAATAGEKRVLH